MQEIDLSTLEQNICNLVCDYADDPAYYRHHVLAVNRNTLEVSLVLRNELTPEQEWFILSDLAEPADDCQELEVDLEAVHDVASRYFE